jgi:hypothetical protein
VRLSGWRGESDARRRRVRIRAELLSLRRKAGERIFLLAEVRYDGIRLVGGIEVEIVATFAQHADGVDQGVAIAQ